MTSRQTFLAAISRVRPKLVDMINIDNWTEIEEAFDEKLQQLNTAKDDVTAMKSALALQKLIVPFTNVRERLLLEIILEGAFEQINPEISQLAENIEPALLFTNVSNLFTWGGSTETFYMRDISLHTGGDLKATSVKGHNLRLDPWVIVDLAGTATLDLVGALTLNPLFIALCILLTLRTLQKAATIELSQNEASVFLGFINTLRENPRADEAVILEKTNRVRQSYALGILSNTQFNKLIEHLENLGSIELVDGLWHVTEEYVIRD